MGVDYTTHVVWGVLTTNSDYEGLEADINDLLNRYPTIEPINANEYLRDEDDGAKILRLYQLDIRLDVGQATPLPILEPPKLTPEVVALTAIGHKLKAHVGWILINRVW